MEVWGGIECTVNRTRSGFMDQLHLSGHHNRLDDLKRIADLGIRTLRYPVLWERACATVGATPDFRWTDERMAELDRLGIRPIIGLIHHGSGPIGTDLMAFNFVEGFVDYAAAVAARYPHVTQWTPVNEPLTTARFVGLYGHWYPHAQDRSAFWTALINQIDATRGAMDAIRSHCPEASLIQTEDVGRTYSTPGCAPVAARNNERRWLGFDLLEGHIDERHPYWPEIERAGLAERALAIAGAPCPPDVIGLNHYVTSDRFLDDRPSHVSPLPSVGYHDVEAVRIMEPLPPGLGTAIDDVWTRYERPIAITELQLACTREEQMRWLHEGWNVATAKAEAGVDIRAVTPWALFGSFDWDRLLTQPRGHYEVGAFDVRDTPPRTTGVARVIKALASAVAVDEPACQAVGWWRGTDRLRRRPFVSDLEVQFEPEENAPDAVRPLLITGASGTLGRAFAEACKRRNLAYVLTDRTALDFADRKSAETVLSRIRPWGVVNAAGYVRVDDAEGEPEACLTANRDGAIGLAEACAANGVRYVAFSSDLVFDGTRDGPYLESDAPRPLSVYGWSKAEAEEGILAAGSDALIIRTAAFFSPYDDHNFAMHVENQLRRDQLVVAARGFYITPTFVPDLVHTTLELLIDHATGIRHLTNHEPMDWYGWALRIADSLDLDRRLIVPSVSASELGWRAARPQNAALGTQLGRVMPDFLRAHERHRLSRSCPTTGALRTAA